MYLQFFLSFLYKYNWYDFFIKSVTRQFLEVIVQSGDFSFIHSEVNSLTLAAATLFSAETPSSSTRALAAVAALSSLYETSPACRALISALFAVAFSALNPSVTT